jgi:hypothetical protein
LPVVVLEGADDVVDRQPAAAENVEDLALLLVTDDRPATHRLGIDIDGRHTAGTPPRIAGRSRAEVTVVMADSVGWAIWAR